MQKMKFKISGMHCVSCAALIEEKLKNISGVISAKANYDSQLGVVIFDEQKIKEAQIEQLIEKAGDFKTEKIKEPKKETVLSESRAEKPAGFLAGLIGDAGKATFVLGFLLGFGLISGTINIVFAANYIGAAKTDQFKPLAADNAVKNQPTPNPSPSQPPAAPAPAVPQTFQIAKKDHVRGEFSAPITLVEFSDFECPFCARHYPTMNKILSDYKGKVRLVYKHFPLGFHPNAQKAAEASECADEQGKFWEYHDKIFENQSGSLSLEKFKSWAGDLGLNTQKFNDCLDSGKFADKVKADSAEGQQKGVNGTPATFVNGQLVSGALPYENFKQIIDNLISQ